MKRFFESLVAISAVVLSVNSFAQTPLPISQGGTGATTAQGAIANLGAASSGSNADITSLSGLTTPLSISQGGTGATTATSFFDTAYCNTVGYLIVRFTGE